METAAFSKHRPPSYDLARRCSPLVNGGSKKSNSSDKLCSPCAEDSSAHEWSVFIANGPRLTGTRSFAKAGCRQPLDRFRRRFVMTSIVVLSLMACLEYFPVPAVSYPPMLPLHLPWKRTGGTTSWHTVCRRRVKKFGAGR